MIDSPIWPEFEIPNPQVADLAGNYAGVAQHLFDNRRELNCVPSLMLESAFAIELYLKSLSSKTVCHPIGDGIDGYQMTAKPTITGHDLEKLYEGIDERIKAELQEAYAASPAVPDLPILCDAFARFAKVFVGIRYPFENREQEWTGHTLDDLNRLMRFIQGQIENMPKRYAVVDPDPTDTSA